MHKSAVGKIPRRGWAHRNRGIIATKEGTSWEGVEMIGSKIFLAGYDISSRLNIMAGFLSCRNVSMNMQSRKGFL